MDYTKYTTEELIEVAALQSGQIALLEEKIELLKELNCLLLRTNHKFVDILGEDNDELLHTINQKKKKSCNNGE